MSDKKVAIMASPKWLAGLRRDARILQSIGEILTEEDLKALRDRAQFWKHPDEAFVTEWVEKTLSARNLL